MATRNLTNPKPRAARAASTLSQPMRYRAINKRNANHPIHRLPFVAPADIGLNFWAFPQPSCYEAGFELGKAAGIAFLKALRESGTNRMSAYQFQSVVLSAIEAGAQPDPTGGRRGIACGFFAEVGYWLCLGVEVFGSSLDGPSQEELAGRMNRAAIKSEAQVDAEICAALVKLNAEKDEATLESKAA